MASRLFVLALDQSGGDPRRELGGIGMTGVVTASFAVGGVTAIIVVGGLGQVCVDLWFM